MTVDRPTTTSKTTTQEYARLNDEVRHLLDFKKSNVKGRNRTPCPECATPVDINAKKCPQCASDIAGHTANVRQHLAELDEHTAELDQLHNRYIEYREEEAAMQPFLEKIRRLVSGPQMAAGFNTVLPSFLLFFAFIATLRIIGNGPLFWASLLAGGFVAYSVLKKSSFKYYVTVELYRAVLIVGLIIMMSGAVMIIVFFGTIIVAKGMKMQLAGRSPTIQTECVLSSPGRGRQAQAIPPYCRVLPAAVKFAQY